RPFFHLKTMYASIQTLGLIAAMLVAAACYWPGLGGPWLFDDTTNILQNAPLRLDSLSPQALLCAAWSLESGPLKRPLAYLSFALNHYFAGGYNAFAFKATNLAIHLLNSLLVAALAWRVAFWVLADQLGRRRGLALLAAAIFALHPLALSPVLYVVQRMASLSTLFVLASILCLLRARGSIPVGAGHARDRDTGPGHDTAKPETVAVAAMGRSYNIGVTGWLAPIGWLLAGGLLALCGLFTKENAALLPLFYLLADRVCFPDAPYWCWLGRPGRGGRLTRGTLWLLAAAAAGLLAWYVAPGYAVRPFTLTERVLTEGRVLWFYLGLFALPRIDAFGLYHDDIALSTGLLTPWTTLPALLGLAGLTWLGFRLLRRAPLVGFGVLWFLTGHLMESTLIPLEIAHEHRNYLPLVGLACASAWLLVDFYQRTPRPALVATGIVLAVLAATTALRAVEWRDADTFYRYQVEHHPDSAHSRNDYASELGKRRRYGEALEQLRAAQRIAPWEAGYYFNYLLTARTAGLAVPADVTAELDALLRSRPLTAFGLRAVQTQGDCLRKVCSFMAADMAGWLATYISAPVDHHDRSQLEYLLGLAYVQQAQVGPALNAFERAYSLDPKYLHPLFEQANIFMALGQWDNAAFNLERIREANQTAPVRQDKALAQLEAAIANGRSGN
ncbi:MAG TPA: tetratricopeptide repeat protein, partial [Immundisolibacter sp.]|nr:tetratricopeptide repeat protein [Immundisolibacter sp.]